MELGRHHPYVRSYFSLRKRYAHDFVDRIMDRRDLRPMNSDPFAAPKSTRKATPTPGPRGGSRGTIRDVSWHPYRPEMMAVSWEGRMGSHGHVQLVSPHSLPVALSFNLFLIDKRESAPMGRLEHLQSTLYKLVYIVFGQKM